jgi:hypothetical protein
MRTNLDDGQEYLKQDAKWKAGSNIRSIQARIQCKK